MTSSTSGVGTSVDIAHQTMGFGKSLLAAQFRSVSSTPQDSDTLVNAVGSITTTTYHTDIPVHAI